MSNDPLSNNPNFKNLFKISSNANTCSIIERIELYQHKTDNYFVLFRYQIDNMTMPIRILLKFTDLIHCEVTQIGNTANLYLTTAFKDLNIVSQRVNMCCGNLSYVLQVEKAIYDNLLN
jgi:hypothetical protein